MSAAPPGAVHIVGLGRLGRALRHGWASAEPPVPWADRPDDADTVVLCVPDDALAEAAGRLAGRLTRQAVALHCAGAFASDVLAPSGAVHRASMHPAQTVADRDDPARGAAALRGAWAAVEGSDAVAIARAEALAAAAGLRPVRVAAERKALWHAAAVLACADVVALLHVADRLVRDGAGVPAGVEALLPLVRQTLENVGSIGLVASRTGPVARGDEGTVARHRAALADHPAALALYDALDRAARDVGR